MIALLSSRDMWRADFEEKSAGKTEFFPSIQKWVRNGTLKEGDFLIMAQGSFPKDGNTIRTLCSGAGVKILLIPDHLAHMNPCNALITLFRQFLKSPETLRMNDGVLSFIPLGEMMQAATAGLGEENVKQVFRDAAGI